jgi:uncharacterized protein with HEPN domain
LSPSKDAKLPLSDILESIESIESFTRGLTLDQFEHDNKTVAAVERKLQIISEAAIRLETKPSALPRSALAQHSWHRKLAAP